MSGSSERERVRKRIFERDKFHCAYCGLRGSEGSLTLDHVIPLQDTRTSEYYGDEEYGIPRREILTNYAVNKDSNLVTACWICNGNKGQKSIKEFFSERPSAVKTFLKRAVHVDRRILESMAALG